MTSARRGRLKTGVKTKIRQDLQIKCLLLHNGTVLLRLQQFRAKFGNTLLRDGVSERYTRTLYPGFIIVFLFVPFVQILYLPIVPDALRQIMYCCTMCFPCVNYVKQLAEICNKSVYASSYLYLSLYRPLRSKTGLQHKNIDGLNFGLELS